MVEESMRDTLNGLAAIVRATLLRESIMSGLAGLVGDELADRFGALGSRFRAGGAAALDGVTPSSSATPRSSSPVAPRPGCSPRGRVGRNGDRTFELRRIPFNLKLRYRSRLLNG